MHLPIHLDRTLSAPLQDQLFEQLRRMIVAGRLKPGSRVIATRFLAEQTDVSRTTVLLAYERLISEGYLEATPGVGTFVCSALPEQLVEGEATGPQKKVSRQAERHPPALALELKKVVPGENPCCRIDFRTFHADPELLPARAWVNRGQHILERHREGLADHPPPAGVEPLRQAIADWLAARRGMAIGPEQVIIVAGRQQARHIVARMFVRPGDRVIVESPGQSEAGGLFESMGAAVVPVPVDEHGIRDEDLPQGPASLAYVTPSRQRPIGGTLPLSRRERLIEWARKTGAYIIEDDCDGKFRYAGIPPSPLAALDPYGLVFHVGTFSKTLGAGLCLGYLIVPPEFVEPVIAAKAMFSKGCSWLDQMILADFMASGEYDHHLRRMRKSYMERRDCLVALLRKHFGDVHLIGAETGTQLTWLLPPDYPPARSIKRKALALGVGIHAPDDDARDGQANPYTDRVLIFGYSALNESQMREGIAILATALRPRMMTA